MKQEKLSAGGSPQTSHPSTADSYLEMPQGHDMPLVSLMVRRETHSSRSLATVLLALLLIALLVWLGTELILSALGLAPLLLSWEEIFSAVFSAPQLLPPTLGIALGLLLALLGIFLLFLACAPGGLKRHSSCTTGRFAFLLDDKVLAAGLSAAIRRQTGLTRDQVVTRVSPRQVLLTVTPTSGHRLDAQELTRLAQATADSYALKPALQARVRIEKQGVLSHG